MPNLLAVYEELDPKFYEMVMENAEYNHADGVLPSKTKQLILMVLNAVSGASDGVIGASRNAMKAGATKEEIMEALRVAQYQCGVGCLYTAAKALKINLSEHSGNE